jgi:hypothetical protein
MNNSRPHLFGMLAGLFLAAGLVVASMLVTTTWLKIKNSQFITVKGSTHKDVESDLVVWYGNFYAEAATLLDAQKKLQDNRLIVSDFLVGDGITNGAFAPIVIEELKGTLKTADGMVSQRTMGFRLTQSVRVESSDVDRIDKLDTTALVEQGVIFTTEAPDFIYTHAGEAKVEMLADATKDARARAEQIAGQGGRNIASLHDADMGIFQITPEHDSQTSAEGQNDKTARRKTITAVVTATFLLK